MKINRKSWHYRLNCEMGCGEVPKNLCGYFWETIKSILGAIFCIAVCMAFVIITTLPIWQPLYKWLFNPSISLFGTYVTIASYTIGGIIFGVSSLSQKSFARVTIGYITSIKDKYCPIIEFTEE